MTELEEQQQAEIKKLHRAIDKACTDFNTLHLEICEGKSDWPAFETIFDELEESIKVAGLPIMFDSYGIARATPSEF